MQSIEDRIHQYEPFFGDWELKDPPELLGRGNSGTVFRIWDRSTGGVLDAAMKAIPIPRDDRQVEAWLKECGGSHDRLAERIRQELEYVKIEIQTMETLRSDSHIVCFERYEIHQRKDTTLGWDVLIRMERLIPLSVFLRNIDRYPHKRDLRLVLTIWDELLSGLCLCERNHVLHLDIKPDNIFYAEPSKDYFKLGDFGVSIRNEKDKIAGKGTRLGTEEYMAPEMYNFQGSDSRSDMYSLAVVVYELLNGGRLPFMAPNARNTDEERFRARRLRLSGKEAIPPIKGVDQRLMQILLKALAYDPNERYPDMQQMQAALRAYLYGSKDQAAPASPRAKGAKPKSKLPLFVGLGVAGALGVMAVLLLKPSPTQAPGDLPHETAVTETTPTPQDTPTPTPTPEDTPTPTPTPEDTPTPTPTPEDTPTPTPTPEDTPTPTPTPQDTPTPTPQDTPTPTPVVTQRPPLSVEAALEADISEDQQALALRSNRAVDVSLYYAGDEESLYDSKVGEISVDGETPVNLTVDFPLKLEEGRWYLLTYEDEEGQTRELARGQVGPSQRRQLEIDVPGLRQVEGQQWPVFSGEKLDAAVRNADGRAFVAMSLRVPEIGEDEIPESKMTDDSGYAAFESEWDARSYGIRDAGMLVELRAEYADGLAAGRSASKTVLWTTDRDVTPLAVARNVMEGDRRVELEAEPGAKLRVLLNGEALGEVIARDDGACAFEGDRAFAAGDRLSVEATDRFGNPGRLDGIEVTGYLTDVAGLEDGVLWADTATVTGVARPGATLEVWFADGQGNRTEKATEADVGEDGRFSAQVYAPKAEGESLRVNLTAGNEADGFHPLASGPFDWQLKTQLHVEALTEDSPALVVRTAEGAKVTVRRSRDGWEPATEQPAKNGAVEIPAPEGGFEKGDAYYVVAVDAAHGNLNSEAEVTVAEARRAPIEAAVANGESFEGRSVVRGDSLLIRGAAEPNRRVRAVWGDGSVSGEAEADGNGRFELTLSAGDAIPPAGAESGIALSYADGRAAMSNCELPAHTWTTDDACPVAVDTVMDHHGEITVHTDPGARVTVRRGLGIVGESVAEGEQADENGLFARDVETRAGDAFHVSCVDGFGNASETLIVPVYGFGAEVENLTEGSLRSREAVLSGRSSPHARLTVTALVNGHEEASEEVETDGQGAFRQPFGAWNGVDGRNVQFRVVNEDGRAHNTEPFTWNVTVPVKVRALSEDSQKLVVETEPGAQVLVTRGGKAVYDVKVADDRGACEFTPTLSFFHAGDRYDIRVSDPSDATRQGTASVEVQEAGRLPIRADIQEVMDIQGRGTVRGGALKLTGKAEVGETVRATWREDGSIFGTAAVQDDGSFAVELKANGRIGDGGRSSAVDLSYDSGKARSMWTSTKEVLWTEDDVPPRLETSGLVEGDRTLTVASEPNTSVTVFRANVALEEGATDGSGRYTYTFDAPLEAGLRFTVVAVDGFENRAEAQVEVAQDEYRPITLAATPGDWINAGTGTLALAGEAQPNAKLTLSVAGRDYEQAVGADGTYRWEADIDTLGLQADGEITLGARYREGHVNRAAAGVTVKVDRSVPTLDREAIGLDRLGSGSNSIAGVTEPGAAVTLDVNGARVQEMPADGDGRFEFRNVALKDNDALVLAARDAAGNESRLEAAVKRQQAGRITAAEPSADGTRLHVTGWAVADRTDFLTVQLDDNLGLYPDPQEVSADALAGELQDFQRQTGDPVNVIGNTCVRIDKDFDIGSLSQGGHTVRLVWDNWEQQVELDSAGFEKAQSAGGRTNAPWIDEDGRFAFGLDARPAMNGDGILLTGWYYGPAKNDAYTVSEVRLVESWVDDYSSREGILAQIDKLPGKLALDGPLTQDYVKKKRLDVPRAVADDLPEVTADPDNAGFMVWIDSWNLEDGDYQVVVLVQNGGKMQYPSMPLTIRNGQPAITAPDLQAIADVWDPPPVEEEEEAPAP